MEKCTRAFKDPMFSTGLNLTNHSSSRDAVLLQRGEASVIPLLKAVGQRGEVLDGRNECLAMKWHLNPSDIISAGMPLPHGD